VREQAVRTVRYVGYPPPSTAGAVEYWAADGETRARSDDAAGYTTACTACFQTDRDTSEGRFAYLSHIGSLRKSKLPHAIRKRQLHERPHARR
jgi:hypothetical protein